MRNKYSPVNISENDQFQIFLYKLIILIKDRSFMATDRSEKVEQLIDMQFDCAIQSLDTPKKLKKQNVYRACRTAKSNVENDVRTHLSLIIIKPTDVNVNGTRRIMKDAKHTQWYRIAE